MGTAQGVEQALEVIGLAKQNLNPELEVLGITLNIANMRTTGYKKQRAAFQDLIYDHVRRVGAQASDQGTILPVGVDIGGGVIESLEPVRGLPLRALYCAHNKITSLEPLRGMKLVTLNCNGNPISDLEPLRGMPMTSLWFQSGALMHDRICCVTMLAD